MKFPKTPSEMRAACALSVCSDYDDAELTRLLAIDPAEALQSIPLRDAMRIVAGLLPRRQLVTWSRAAADRAQGYAHAVDTAGAPSDVYSHVCAAAAYADTEAYAVARAVARGDTRIDAAIGAVSAMGAASAAAALAHASACEAKLSIELGLELLDTCPSASRADELRDACALPICDADSDRLLANGLAEALRAIQPRDAAYVIAGLLPRLQLVAWAKEAAWRAWGYTGDHYPGRLCALAAEESAKDALYATTERSAAIAGFRAIKHAADAAIYDPDGVGELKRVLSANELRLSVDHGITLLGLQTAHAV